jgi:hypothetical protein
MTQRKLLFCSSFLIAACFWSSIARCEEQSMAPGNQHNRANPGWYGWIGDFHDVNGFYGHPADRAYYKQHNMNWFLLSHQWIVPFLESDTYNVREAINENKGRARLWYEAYWWGDHTTWVRPDRKGFGMQHIPQHVLDKLAEQGIEPGGDNIVGKDWVAAATDPQVMASIKKTIQWQIDTIIEHCGPDALYGVVLSEEEPDHGVHVTLGEPGFEYYGAHRDEIRPLMAAVHNELYDFVKARYPQLKVSPGFYPLWVEPGTLKMDAVVMDLYPPPGKEQQYIDRWVTAYGEVPAEDHYIILWGYGDGDRAMEIERFNNITNGLIARGYRNLGFFRPELALRDRVHQMWDVDASGNYGPYDIDEHRAGVETLWSQTTTIAGAIATINADRAPALPTMPDDAYASRDNITDWARQIYDYRHGVLETAYEHMRSMRDMARLTELAGLLKAEGLIPTDTDAGMHYSSSQLNEWEALSKEYRTVPQYYAATLAVEKQMVERAQAVGRVVDASLDQAPVGRYPATIEAEATGHIRRIADRLDQAQVADARQAFEQLFDMLFDNQVEQSYQLRIVFKNGYDFALNLLITLACEWPDGQVEEIYSDYPCETADRFTELRLFLPQRPTAIQLGTCSWSGALTVSEWQLFNSRGDMEPTAVEDIDHVEKIEAWRAGESDSFDLLPWASVAGAKIVYGSAAR